MRSALSSKRATTHRNTQQTLTTNAPTSNQIEFAVQQRVFERNASESTHAKIALSDGCKNTAQFSATRAQSLRKPTLNTTENTTQTHRSKRSAVCESNTEKRRATAKSEGAHPNTHNCIIIGSFTSTNATRTHRKHQQTSPKKHTWQPQPEIAQMPRCTAEVLR